MGEEIKFAHPSKVETGHKWTTRYIKWKNYIGSMVGVLGITLVYVIRRGMPAVWTAANKHDRQKHQAIHIGLDRESEKMTVYTDLKDCCLDGEVWLWIISYNAHKDG